MKAVLVALLCSPGLVAQQLSSADRVAPAAPVAAPNLIVRVLQPAEPEFEPYHPISSKQRLHEYLDGTIGHYQLFRAAASALVSQELDSPHEWGQGVAGYARRFGNDLAENGVRSTLTFAYSYALHEDNRYFASGKSNAALRILHAALSPFEAHRADGSVRFSFSNAAGVVSASLISRTWAPPSWQGGANIGRNIGLTFAGQAAFNAFREFVPDLLHGRR
jgi:hypothetical protein